MIIYRVQHKNGRGPFKPGMTQRWAEQEERPGYVMFNYNEYITDKCKYTGCGCESIKQLKKWFTENEYNTLKKLGYNAVKMYVDIIHNSDEFQCIFGRKKPLKKNCAIFDLYKEGNND